MHDLLAFLRNKHIPGVPVYPVNCPLSTMSVASPSCHYYDMDKELRKVKKPRLVVICGPSGCGKSSLVNRLMADLGKDTVGFSVSHTTREPRHDDEQEGVHFHFFSDEAFDRAIQNDEFVEHTEFCGHRYGTSKRAVLSVLETGKLCLLELNIQVKSSKLILDGGGAYLSRGGSRLGRDPVRKLRWDFYLGWGIFLRIVRYILLFVEVPLAVLSKTARDKETGISIQLETLGTLRKNSGHSDL